MQQIVLHWWNGGWNKDEIGIAMTAAATVVLAMGTLWFAWRENVRTSRIHSMTTVDEIRNRFRGSEMMEKRLEVARFMQTFVGELVDLGDSGRWFDRKYLLQARLHAMSDDEKDRLRFSFSDVLNELEALGFLIKLKMVDPHYVWFTMFEVCTYCFSCSEYILLEQEADPTLFQFIGPFGKRILAIQHTNERFYRRFSTHIPTDKQMYHWLSNDIYTLEKMLDAP